MHYSDVDVAEAISRCRQTDDTEMRYRLPVQSCQELGQRAWYVDLLLIVVRSDSSSEMAWQRRNQPVRR